MEVRIATRDEVEPAVRMLLGNGNGAADENNVANFVQLALSRRDGVSGAWIAVLGSRLISAILPVVSPGRTMLIFCPQHLRDQAQMDATRQLIETVCGKALGSGVRLAQVLLESHHPQLEPMLTECSFKPLAELMYLQAHLHRTVREPQLEDGFKWTNYSRETHELFARTIMASYDRSLDCPALNGLRDVDDILAGHRATGEFDPALWFVLTKDDEAAGALLLSRVPRSDVTELVYLGVTLAFRGKGIGDCLMRRAATAVSSSKQNRLSLAVDASNLPALGLYWRHGLQVIGRKKALLRDLRVPKVTISEDVKEAQPRADAT